MRLPTYLISSASMEASAGLVAGSHNCNELFVVYGHKKLLRLWIKVVVTTWLVWTNICVHGHVDGVNYLRLPMQNNESTSSVAFTGQKNDYSYASFNTFQATEESYGDFMTALRSLLVSELPPVHEIPRVRDPSTVDVSERFVLVNLRNSYPYTITLALDVTNLYVVGYRTGDQFYYFLDTADHVDSIFPNIQHNVLPFNSSYGALARQAGSRENIRLGMASLEQAIEDLHEYREASLARAFTVVIQMVSEAARFGYIENFLQLSITAGSSPFPSQTMLNLENNWYTLSTRIQHSRDGILDPPVQLIDRHNNPISLTRVTPGIVLNVAIMIFVCTNSNPSSITWTQLTPSGLGDHDGICTNIPEPTVRISGRNGYCVDVENGYYNNGNPIILWPCKSNEDVNQLWTVKADGTIQSNGKCLTTYAFWGTAYIMIYDCRSAVADATKWKIFDNGTIINPRSSFVLTANKGSADTTLTLEKNVNGASQGWLVSNNTDPIVTSIIGLDNLCMQEGYGGTVGLMDCKSQETKQEWAIYPDGSIRTNGNRDNCLTADKYNAVVIDPCDGSASQRWSFNRDYSIANVQDWLVMDAQKDRSIVVYPKYDTSSQEWHAWFL